MTHEALAVFWPFCLFIIMLFIIGLYCLIVTFNLIRALIGVEILLKAVTLLFIVVGYVTKHTAMMQSLIITMIVLEVVVVTIAAGVIIGMHKYNNSLDVRNLRRLRG